MLSSERGGGIRSHDATQRRETGQRADDNGNDGKGRIRTELYVHWLIEQERRQRVGYEFRQHSGNERDDNSLEYEAPEQRPRRCTKCFEDGKVPLAFEGRHVDQRRRR